MQLIREYSKAIDKIVMKEIVAANRKHGKKIVDAVLEYGHAQQQLAGQRKMHIQRSATGGRKDVRPNSKIRH